MLSVAAPAEIGFTQKVPRAFIEPLEGRKSKLPAWRKGTNAVFVAVSQNSVSLQRPLKYYSPCYGDPQKGTPNFGKVVFMSDRSAASRRVVLEQVATNNRTSVGFMSLSELQSNSPYIMPYIARCKEFGLCLICSQT